MMLLNSCRLFFQERGEDLFLLVLCKKWLAQVGLFQVLVAAEKPWVQTLSQVWKFTLCLSVKKQTQKHLLSMVKQKLIHPAMFY